MLKGSGGERDDERGRQEQRKAVTAANQGLIIFTFTSSELSLSHSLPASILTPPPHLTSAFFHSSLHLFSCLLLSPPLFKFFLFVLSLLHVLVFDFSSSFTSYSHPLHSSSLVFYLLCIYFPPFSLHIILLCVLTSSHHFLSLQLRSTSF